MLARLRSRRSTADDAEATLLEGIVLGTLASHADVTVTPSGAVHPDGAAVGLEWVVGTADGWQRAAGARPSAVGQRLVDGLPVVETSLRIPGGQLLQRAWVVAPLGGAEVAVLEVENRATEAVSVALEGGAAATFTASRRPARTVTAADVDAPFPVADGAAASIWPLAHTATLRVAVVLHGEWDGDVDGLPDAEAVVRGWRGHLDAGARVALPDPGLAAGAITARAALLARASRLASADLAAASALALAGWGHHDAALAPIEQLLDHQRLDGAFDRAGGQVTADALAAWSGHVVATGSTDLAERLVEPAAKAAHRLGKLRWKSSPPPWVDLAQRDAAALLDLAGQPEAAALCRARVGARADGDAPGVADPVAWPAAGADLDAQVGGRDLRGPASYLRAVLGALVDDTAPGVLRLLPARWPDEWLGADLEAHRLPTRHGSVSFAVRWHGARPALLWELDGTAPVRIEVPGLDAAWSSADAAGEGLLGAIEPAGGLPGVVAPLASEGTPVDEAPDDGVSFH